MSQFIVRLHIPIVVVAMSLISLISGIATAQQEKDDRPATYVEFGERKTRLVQEFQSQPDLSLDDKVVLIRKILALDSDAINRLESGEAAYVAGVNESPESLVSAVRNATIGSSFFLANLLDEAGRYGDSAETLEYVLANSLKFYGDDHWKTLEFQLKLEKEKWLVGANENQLAAWAQAKMANSNGLIEFRNNELPKARELLTLAKSTLEELSLQHTMAYGEAVANLAEVVAASDSPEATEAAFQKAFEVNDKLFAMRSPTNANMRQSLALYYSRHAMPQKSIELFAQATEIFKTVYGEKSVALAQNLSLIGTQLFELKQYQEAQNNHLKAFAMLTEIGQRNSQASLYVLRNMFQLLSSLGQHKDAADVAELAVPVAEAVYGTDRIETATWLLRSGNANRADQKFEKAVESFSAARLSFETMEGFEKNQQYIECLSGLAATFYSMKKFDQAVELAAQAAKLSKDAAGENSIFHLVRAQNLALFLNQNKEYQKAEDEFAHILPLLKEVLGDTNIDYQKTIFDRATNLLQFEKVDAAIEQLTYLRGIQESSIGKAHPDYSTTLKSLADAYEKKGATDLHNAVTEELAKIKQEEAAKVEPDKAGGAGSDKQVP